MKKLLILKKLLITIFYLIIIGVFPESALAATLSLSPQVGTFNKGCTFSLDIKLDSGGIQTDGTDAILKYDQSRVSATSISSGTIYADYPGNNISDSSGLVTVSGLASVSSPFSGTGTFATVNFKVLDTAQAGATQIRFDFDPNDKTKTTDSNVVERGTVADVLSSVVDGNYVIGTGSCVSASPSPTPSPSSLTGGGRGALGPGQTATPSAQPLRTPSPTLPPGGTPELTFTLTIVGSVLTVLGILGLAFL